MEADYFWDFLRGNSLSCRYKLPEKLVDSSTNVEVQDRFIQALAQTVLDHPMLQAVIVFADKKRPKFARLEALNLDDVVEWHVVSASKDYGSTTDGVVNEQLDKVFKSPDVLPGWRIVVTSPEQAAFLDVHLLVRHTMLDGESRKIFNTSLLNHLNNPPDHEIQRNLFLQGHTVKIPSQGPEFPPPMEKFGDFSTELKYVFSKSWQELKPSFLQKPSSTQKSWGPFKIGDYQTERRTIRINPLHTQKIIHACRSHNTTITGFLHGIILASLLWECRETVHSQSYSASSAVNLRRFMPSRPKTMPNVEMDPSKTIVNMLTAIDHEFDELAVQNLLRLMETSDQDAVDCRHYEDIVWSVAESTRLTIKEKLDNGLKNDIMSLMKLVPDWRSEKKKSCKKARHESWLVTNLGVFDGQKPTDADEKRNRWYVDHALFAPSVDVARGLFMISAISAKDGDLCLGVAWQTGLGEYVDRIGNRLTRDMHSWCHYIATSEWIDDWVQQPFLEYGS